MAIEIKVPSPGESITEVEIAQWLVADGDYVEKEDELCEIDSDKATLTINAEESGQIKLMVQDGDTVAVGDTICSIDTSVKASLYFLRMLIMALISTSLKVVSMAVWFFTPTNL